MEDNIASQLYRGSKNIDQMKAEIHAVVSMLVGFLWENCGQETLEFKGDDALFVNEQYKWSIRGWIKHEDDRHTEGCVIVEFCPTGSDNAHMYYGDNRIQLMDKRFTLDVRFIESVYDTLPQFVYGMFKRVPALKECCEPLLRVANKFKK